MNKNKKVVIVGGGHAGGNLIASLRQAGFSGSITLVSDEDALPYHRPPLSKSWLKETTAINRLHLKPPNFYDEKLVDVVLGTKVDKIDTIAKKVFLESGAEVEYDYLVLATGARARSITLSGGEFENILYLRNLADAENLKSQLSGAKHLAVIGGGYIGLEVAASARQLGLKVSVIERESRLLARVASRRRPCLIFISNITRHKVSMSCFGKTLPSLTGGTDDCSPCCLKVARSAPLMWH